MERGFLSIFRGCVAVLAIYIAVVSRIPTSHCRCHEKKPIEQTTKKKCPFGELRLLAEVTILSAIFTTPRADFVFMAVAGALPVSFGGRSMRYVDARAPPHRFS